MPSYGTTPTQHPSTVVDDLRHSDCELHPITLSNDGSAIAPAAPDATVISELITDVPTPPYNRPRRVELTTLPNCGTKEAAEFHEFIAHETAITSCNSQSNDILLSQEAHLQHVVQIALILTFI